MKKENIKEYIRTISLIVVLVFVICMVANSIIVEPFIEGKSLYGFWVAYSLLDLGC